MLAQSVVRSIDGAYFNGMGSVVIAERGFESTDEGLRVHLNQMGMSGTPRPWIVFLQTQGKTLVELNR